MQSNKKAIFIVVLLILLIAVTFISFQYKSGQGNILSQMKNGLDDPTTSEIYQDIIDDVAGITNGSVIISYVDIDLDNNKQFDKIAIISSPFHSGSHGDTFDILRNDNGSFVNIYSATIRLYSQSKARKAVGAVYVLDTLTNGFKDIEIVTDGDLLILKHKDGMYQLIEESV